MGKVQNSKAVIITVDLFISFLFRVMVDYLYIQSQLTKLLLRVKTSRCNDKKQCLHNTLKDRISLRIKILSKIRKNNVQFILHSPDDYVKTNWNSYICSVANE